MTVRHTVQSAYQEKITTTLAEESTTK